MTIPKPTFTHLLLLIAIGIIIIGSWRACGNDKTWEQKVVEKEEARKKSIDSSLKEINYLLDSAGKVIEKWQDSVESKEADAEVYRYERNEAWKGLEQSKKEADKLVAKIRELNGADSLDCLELADRFVDASGQVIFYKKKSDELVAKLDTAGAYKDTIIAQERSLKKHALEVGYETAQAYSALHASFKRLSPHSSVWVGAEGSYSPFGSTIGGVIAFQTKKGTQYLGGIGLNSKDVGYYFKAGILWKISLRKK